MSHFYKKVDKRNRSVMTEFLLSHYRYDTMNSWNASTSYANRIKLRTLGLTREQEDRAYDVLDTDFWRLIDLPIRLFTKQQGGRHTIGTNGRSGGYLVLYQSQYESTGYRSYCTRCGQRNHKAVPPEYPNGSSEKTIATVILNSGASYRDPVYLAYSPIAALSLSDDEKLELIRRLKAALKNTSSSAHCGRCGAMARINYVEPPVRLSLWPGRDIDMDGDFSEWPLEDLRERVDLVQDFDRACDDIRSAFIDLVDGCEVVERTMVVPRQVRQLVCDTNGEAL